MKTQSSALLSSFTFFIAMTIAGHVHADVVAKAYDIKNVNEVVVTGGGRLQLTQGDTESLRVEADQKIIDRVVVDLSGDKLTLSIKNGTGKDFNFFHWFENNKEDITYTLQLKNLTYLGLSGATRATLGNLNGKNLEVKGSGAADITFNNLTLEDIFIELTGASNSRFQKLTADKVKVELSGAANLDVKAESKAKFLKVGASGASNFRGKLFTVAQADVDASGASNIDLNATDILKADASGASNIRYLGQPKLQSNASGASHINSTN